MVLARCGTVFPVSGGGRGGCPGGGVPLRAVLVLSWCGEVSLGGILIIIIASVVVGAVPAAVCRLGLCACCPGVGSYLSGVY